MLTRWQQDIRRSKVAEPKRNIAASSLATDNINNNSSNRANMNTNRNRPPAARSAFLAEFLEKRWNPQAGFLDMDDLPDTSHNISVVISKLLIEAKYLFGDSVS